MSLPVWGNLEKSQVDPEKIEEAIARLIQAHEDDPNAHIEAGESLQSHKASAIIDHIIASIVADKLARFSVSFDKLSGQGYYFITCFESIDAWDVDTNLAGSVTLRMPGVQLLTAADDGSWAKLEVTQAGAPWLVDYSKDMMFQITGDFGLWADHLAYATLGGAADDYFGFKFDGVKVYAVHEHGGLETKTEITGDLNYSIDVLRAEFDAGENKIYFYANEVLVATHSTDMPTGVKGTGPFFMVETMADGARFMWINSLVYRREP